jgi:hypothetical protein
MAEDDEYEPFIKTSDASAKVRPLLDELIACFKFGEEEEKVSRDISHEVIYPDHYPERIIDRALCREFREEIYPKMPLKRVIIRINEKVDDVLDRIGDTYDASALPVLANMLQFKPGTDLPVMNWKHLHVDYFKTTCDPYWHNPSLWDGDRMFISMDSSPGVSEVLNVQSKFVGPVGKIADKSPDKAGLIAKYPVLKPLADNYADFGLINDKLVGYQRTTDEDGQKCLGIINFGTLVHKYVYGSKTPQQVYENLGDLLAYTVRTNSPQRYKNNPLRAEYLEAVDHKKESLRNAMDLIRKHYM